MTTQVINKAVLEAGMNTQKTQKFSRFFTAGFFALMMIASASVASSADWTGDFAADLYGSGAGQSGNITNTQAVLYDVLGVAVGTCSAVPSTVYVDNGWVKFDCDFDNSNFNGVDIDLVELVSKELTEIYYTDYLGDAVWELNSLSGTKQGHFSIDLGNGEPTW